MTGGINRAIFPVIFLFLISILPLSQADSSDENGDNILTFSANSEIKSVYLENEVIEIEMALSNFGDNEIFSNDPSCDYYFEAYNEVDEQVYSTKSQCRGQSQSTFLEAMSTNLLQEKTWNFTDQNGSFIESGTYEFRLYHSTLPLANSFEIYFQHISNLEEGLEYQLSNFDNTILVSLSNPTKNEINPQSDYCTIILSINNISTTHRLCNENSKVIYPNQNLEIGYILLDYSMLSYGENVVGISDTGMTLSKNLTFDYLKITNDIDYEDIGIDLEIESEKMFTIDRIPYLELTPYIYNNLDENLLITANNTCLLHNKIYNIRGDIIQDSYSDLCQPSDMNIIINSKEILSLPPISMQLVDQNNCYIDSGNYIISSQIMGTNLQHITNYYFNNIYLN